MSGTSNIQSLATVAAPSIRHLTQSRTPNIIRESRLLRPQSNTYATNGDNCIRFVMPQQNSDWRTSSLRMDVTITTTGVTNYKRLAQGGMMSGINRVRWFSGAVEETYEYYNRIQNMIYNSSVDPDVIASIGQDLLGYGTQAARNAQGAIAGAKVTVPLSIGILSQGVLPLAILARGTDFNFELYLENALWFVETDGSNPVVSITNVQWDYEYVYSMDGKYEAETAAAVGSGRVQFGYPTYACFQNAIINTVNDIQIPWRGNALSSVQCIMVNQATVATTTVNDKFTTWRKTMPLGLASVVEYQIQLKDGLWLPVEPIRCDGFAERAFAEYLKSRGWWSCNAISQWQSAIDITSFNDDQFLMVSNLNAIPVEAYAQDYYFNNLSTLKQSQNTIFRLTLSGVPDAQYVLYSFVCFGTLLDVSPSGVLTRHT